MLGRKSINILLFLAGIIFLISFYFLSHIKAKQNFANSQNTQTQTKQAFEYEAINGGLVSQKTANSRPIAVMIENHPDSRPQSGLAEADVVYEALAEGGITRFLALYQTVEAKQIGPVRSAREYFAQIANEWGAVYAHVGGSSEVINQLKSSKYKNLSDANEYFNFDFFPRRKDKFAPHNIFTSAESIKKLIAQHNFSNVANFIPWLFKNDQPAAFGTISRIDLDFSRAGYEVGWAYDAQLNLYKRLQYFKPHMDESSGRQITAKNVIVQLVKVSPVPNDPLLQVDIDLTSGGEAKIFLDGEKIEGVWKKGSDNKTRYYSQNGEEIRLNRGAIWVELLPLDKQEKLQYE